MDIEHVEQIKWMVMRDTLPASTLEALLTKHGAQVAGPVATELCRRVEQGTLAESLHPAWERAVVESMEGDHELAEISIVRPDLAFAWLKRRILSPRRRDDLGAQSGAAARADRLVWPGESPFRAASRPDRRRSRALPTRPAASGNP